ncbi:MAG TPA: hypothetical protein VJ831_00195 [Jatrophihabitantaceae bacterium]|nr:hypothetical protein [Jatrophihabitantaceae bacterium]
MRKRPARNVHRHDRLAVLFAAVYAAVWFGLLVPGYWYADDFLNFGLARRNGLSTHYLGITVFGHPEPGARLVNWVLLQVAPMDYWLVALMAAASIGVVCLAVYWVLRLLYGPSAFLLLLMNMIGASAIWFPGIAWWSAGVQLMGAPIAFALGTHALVRCYLGDRKVWWGIAAGLWLLAGLLFYERALLLAAVGAAFLPLAVCDDLRPRSVARVLRRALPAYVALAVVGCGYVVWYVHGDFVRRDGRYGTGKLVEYIARNWQESFVPGLLGGPFRWRYIPTYAQATTPPLWTVVAAVVMIAVAIAGWRRLGRRSLRGWFLLVGTVVVGDVTIASARLAAHGVWIAHEYRYLADLVPVAALSLALVLLTPLVGERTSPQPPLPLPGRRIVPAFVVPWIVFLVSVVPASVHWADNPTHGYVNNLRASLAAYDQRGAPWSLYDTVLPAELMPLAYEPFNRMSQFIPVALRRDVTVDQPDADLLVVDESGHAVAARFEIEAARASSCGAVTFVDLPRPLPKQAWFVRLNYRAPKPAVLSVAVDAGRGLVSNGTTTYPVSGSGQLVIPLRVYALTRVRIKSTNSSTCLTSVEVGAPHPA